MSFVYEITGHRSGASKFMIGGPEAVRCLMQSFTLGEQAILKPHTFYLSLELE